MFLCRRGWWRTTASGPHRLGASGGHLGSCPQYDRRRQEPAATWHATRRGTKVQELIHLDLSSVYGKFFFLISLSPNAVLKGCTNSPKVYGFLSWLMYYFLRNDVLLVIKCSRQMYTPFPDSQSVQISIVTGRFSLKSGVMFPCTNIPFVTNCSPKCIYFPFSHYINLSLPTKYSSRVQSLPLKPLHALLLFSSLSLSPSARKPPRKEFSCLCQTLFFLIFLPKANCLHLFFVSTILFFNYDLALCWAF